MFLDRERPGVLPQRCPVILGVKHLTQKWVERRRVVMSERQQNCNGQQEIKSGIDFEPAPHQKSANPDLAKRPEFRQQ